jgi:hypothetical protein
LTVALATTAALGAAALPMAALAIPPGGPAPSRNGSAVTLSATKVAPGGTIRAIGTKFPAGKSVTVKIDDQTIVAVFPISSGGRFSGAIAMPRAIAKVVKPGRHWLRFLAPASSRNHQTNTSIKKPFTLEKR